MAEGPAPLTSTSTEPQKTDLQELQDIRAHHHRYEDLWTARYELLKRHGYSLRPRFRPGWVPSWHGTELNPFDCEDGHLHLVSLAAGQYYIAAKVRCRSCQLSTPSATVTAKP